MSLLIVKDLKKNFAAQEVLRGATFQIDPGQKVGLVGRNGGGKSTLLRLIEGLDQPDGGSVTLMKGARVGHVPQRPVFKPGQTVIDYVSSGLSALVEAIAELEKINEAMATDDGNGLERLMKDHDRLSEKVDRLGGWDPGRMAETVLSGIGLNPVLWERDANTLSGGEKSRTALARELVAGHELLLLDEPTNHLDLDGIEWIESYLREMSGAVLIVSHDRRLLNKSVDSILELEFGELRHFKGNYDRYVLLRQERFDSEYRAWKQQSDTIRKEEAFIKKHMGSQRTAEAKGRLSKLGNIVRLVEPRNDVRQPNIAAPEAARGGEMVLEADDIGAGFDSRTLWENVRLRIGRGQRIGIVGKNGIGKSTLLKILAGRDQPRDGQVNFGHKASCGFYDQETGDLRDDSTPAQEIRRDYPQMTDQQIRSHLARFLFRGIEVDKSVAALSGGERARLSLARLVLTQPSWLAFDEPTNHLDLAGRTALEEMLGAFQGALVCISHDRTFLDALCTHMYEVTPEGVLQFEGNYSDWRRAITDERENLLAEAERKKKAARKQEAQRNQQKGKSKGNKGAKTSGVQQKANAKPKGKTKRPNPVLLNKLENQIIKLEEELVQRRTECTTEDVYRNPERLRETQFRIAEIETELTQANEQWEQWAAG